MEEKILVSSKRYSAFRIVAVVILIGLLLMLISLLQEPIIAFSTGVQEYNYHEKHPNIGRCDGFNNWECPFMWRDYPKDYGSAFSYGIYRFSDVAEELISNQYRYAEWQWGRTAFAISFPMAILVYFALRHYEMVVTNKRVYGKVLFGKRVDIPNDSISAVSTISVLKGVAVASSSGRISFLLVKNANEIYDEINHILIERQNETQKPTEVKQETSQNNIDDLKKYKELLDQGVISQEEFDAKKKQLLGL